MRITIAQGAFLPVPPLMGGAVEKAWFALGKQFARCGHDVTHISREHEHLPKREDIGGVAHVRVAGFDAGKSLIYLKCLDLIYSVRVLRRLPTADILVTNTFWLPILMRDPRCGGIYVHVARYPRGQMRFYSHAARIQTVSFPVAEAIRKEVPRLSSRVSVIPYPLGSMRQIRTQQSLKHAARKQILFVGRLHPEKGVHLLVKAFASIAEKSLNAWRLVIVGPEELRYGGGGERYLSELKSLSKPIADRVQWIGPVFDPTRLAEIYDDAAVFVYPSLAVRGETFGLAPLEAMSHGCVPIVSQLPCFGDYVKDGVSGLVFDHTGAKPEDELAKKLTCLTSSETMLAEFSFAASQKAQEYQLGTIADAHVKDFEAIRKANGAG